MARHAAGDCQHDGFDEQQTNQPAPGGAEREPDRELLPAPQAAGEQQPGDVGRRDEQDERGGSRQEGDDRRVLQLLLDSDAAGPAHEHTPTSVGLGIRGFELARQHVHLRLGILNRGAFGETADEIDDGAPTREPVAIAVTGAEHRRGDPHGVRRLAAEDAVKPFGGDADHGEGSAVDAHARSEDAGVPAESRPPHVVAEDGHGVPARYAIFVCKEEAAQRRLQTQQAEVVGRGDASRHVEDAVGGHDVHG